MEMWFDRVGVDDRGVHRKRVSRQKEDNDVEINLTPMLDVVMIMLIFFIVAGTFITEVVIEVGRNQTTNQASSSPSENISILITASNEIWIHGRRIDARSVRANISRLHAEKPEAKVMLRAHNHSQTRTVAAVIDNCREAGASNIALSTSK
ncbi:ExbD/TolR family protein [Candidatus Litorirhabdus singularis]|nr:biopolymer transporter ExbD [Candidatus Litorirhabdus singularis]